MTETELRDELIKQLTARKAIVVTQTNKNLLYVSHWLWNGFVFYMTSTQKTQAAQEDLFYKIAKNGTNCAFVKFLDNDIKPNSNIAVTVLNSAKNIRDSYLTDNYNCNINNFLECLKYPSMGTKKISM